MTLTLGIDPGSRDGAAVLLQDDGRTVVHWLAWWTARRKAGEVLFAAGTEFDGRHEMAGLGETFVMGLPRGRVHVVCEELFCVPGKVSPKTLLPLAEAAGRVLGVMSSRQVHSERRVRAKDWRRVVLGLPARFAARKAEEYAIDRAPSLFEWCDWAEVEDLPKRARGAVAEAACIARWGVVTS